MYEAGCPMCREGTSWGKKRRLYFVIKDNKICCHNCGWFGSPVDYIIEMSGCSFKDVIDESKKFSGESSTSFLNNQTNKKTSHYKTEQLPEDSINLFDSHQIKFYKNDEIVKQCLDTIVERRLDTAANRPKTMWLSLNDFIHKNRIVIPFYNESNKIVFYQTRKVIDDNDKYPKYLSKSGSEKSIFNIDRVNPNGSHIFIFEGPIDACFVKDGVAVAGIQENSRENFNSLQKQQLSKFILHKKIWVLDSQWKDGASFKKSYNLAQQNENVFIWPDKYGNSFKDFNDMCVSLSIDEIPNNFIIENTFTGNKAIMKLNKLKLKGCF